MERAEQLIEKLRRQMQTGAHPEHILTTIRLLYAEVRALADHRVAPLHAGPVAVIVPGAEAVEEQPGSVFPEAGPGRVVQPLEVDEGEVEAELQALIRVADFKSASTRPPTDADVGSKAPHLQTDRGISSMPGTGQPLPSQEAGSLNDRLGSRDREISDRLALEPVQDLRKAISLNDRYRYINELFRGDHDGYDRALGKLNAFRDIDEAMDWVETEGKGRLAWKAEDELVRQFTLLLQRRFLAR